MAATDPTGDESMRERALGIVRRVAHDFAATPPLADPRALRHRVATAAGAQRSPPGRPLPAPRGHRGRGLEWSRLLLQHLQAALGR
jgi:mannose/cellobiose epimerase-like protein (N-acyl-D-glucosamine 2-epimerase family)